MSQIDPLESNLSMSNRISRQYRITSAHFQKNVAAQLRKQANETNQAPIPCVGLRWLSKWPIKAQVYATGRTRL
jgi:hypothetical protein